MSSVQASVEDKVAVKSAAVQSVARGARARWWRRRGTKRSGFRYEDAAGRRITDETALERIRSLVVPPAWTEVRISPSPNFMQMIEVNTFNFVTGQGGQQQQFGGGAGGGGAGGGLF